MLRSREGFLLDYPANSKVIYSHLKICRNIIINIKFNRNIWIAKKKNYKNVTDWSRNGHNLSNKVSFLRSCIKFKVTILVVVQMDSYENNAFRNKLLGSCFIEQFVKSSNLNLDIGSILGTWSILLVSRCRSLVNNIYKSQICMSVRLSSVCYL